MVDEDPVLLGEEGLGSFPILSGALASEKQSLLARRATWVSTAIPGTPKAAPSTTVAVFQPTPGRRMRASFSLGTSPPYSSTSLLARATRFFALVR